MSRYPIPPDSFYEPPDPPEPPEDMTCEQCSCCKVPPDNEGNYGFCDDCMQWVDRYQNVRELGCENWEL